MALDGNPIIINRDMLAENHIPAEIPLREIHIKVLYECVSPALKRRRPFHAWLYGPPGTGKSTVAKYVLNKIESESFIRGIYVDCWKDNTFYSVLDRLLEELRVLRSEERRTSFKLSRLERYLQDDAVIVVLDDIDQIPQKERNSLIYNLLTLGNIGLICITGSLYACISLDEQIHSRLNARRIEFKPYGHSDLVFLLKQRAEHALAPGSWNERILSRMAELSDGDARVAIQTLSSSAMLAEQCFSGSIHHEHIKKVFNGIKDLKRIFCLRNLTEHHQLLYEIIKQRGEILSQDLREEYEERCEEKNYEAMARRTTDNYLNIDLITAKLITRRRAKMRGKVFIYGLVK